MIGLEILFSLSKAFTNACTALFTALTYQFSHTECNRDFVKAKSERLLPIFNPFKQKMSATLVATQ